MSNQQENDLENLVGMLVLLTEHASEGTSLRKLIEDSFRRPVEELQQDVTRRLGCIVKNMEK